MAPPQKVAAISLRLHHILGRRSYGTFMSFYTRRDPLRTADRIGTATRTMSTTTTPIRRTEPFSVGDILRGSSGRSYNIEEILAHRQSPLLCVYRASIQTETYIIKDLLEGDFEYQQELQKPLSAAPNLRTMVDTIPAGELFVYPFLRDDLLGLMRKPLSADLRKSILKGALTGLVELHDRHIIHTDIKPDNILVNYEETADQEIHVRSVQIADLENAVLLSPNEAIAGCISGNQIWRSPEAWVRAKQDTASDVYSFAIVAIYVMLKQMVFLPEKDAEKNANGESWDAILRNHVSYFADNDGFRGLLNHIGEKNEHFERLRVLAREVTPRKPFALWHPMDAQFQDFIVKMTNLDPKKRITAREALEHPWFRQGRWKRLGSFLVFAFRRMRDYISSKWSS